MKTISSVLISFVVIIVMAYAVTFTGCSNSVTSTGTAPERHQARTESEFTDTNFFADPKAVVYLHLEHLHSPINIGHHDTDSSGIDVFRIRLPRTAEHTFRIGDSSNFSVTLIDKTTRTIVCQLNPVNNFVTVTITAGDYIVVVRSLVEYTGGSDTHQNVFIQPDMNTALNRGSGNQQVDYDTNSVHYLLANNNCYGCDLSYANLSNTNLRFSYLFQANLSYANLSHSDLSHAILEYTNVSNANMSYAKFDSADFYTSNFNYAILSYANLTWTNLSHGIFSHANLSYADLSHAGSGHADFTYANLSYANFSYVNIGSSNFCNAIKTGIIKTGATPNSATQCW